MRKNYLTICEVIANNDEIVDNNISYGTFFGCEDWKREICEYINIPDITINSIKIR